MYYSDCMPAILEQARNRINESGNARAMLSTVSYLLDFCTVRVDLGRGTGATTFMQGNMKRQDVAFFHSHAQLQRFRRLSGVHVTQLFHFSKSTMDRFRPYRFPVNVDVTFWVDEVYPTWDFEHLDLLYSQIATRLRSNDDAPLIVLLG